MRILDLFGIFIVVIPIESEKYFYYLNLLFEFRVIFLSFASFANSTNGAYDISLRMLCSLSEYTILCSFKTKYLTILAIPYNAA